MEKIWYDHTSGEWSGDERGLGKAVSAAKAPEGGVCTLYSPLDGGALFGQTVHERDILEATSGFSCRAGELQSYAADFLAARRRERGGQVCTLSERDAALSVHAADLLLAGGKPVLLCLSREEDVAAANARAEGITSFLCHLFGKKYAEKVGFLCFTEYFPSELPTMEVADGQFDIRFIVYYGSLDSSYDASFTVIRPGDAIPAAPASKYLRAVLSYLHACGSDYEKNVRLLVEKGESMPVYCGGKERKLFEGGAYDELSDYYAASRAWFSLRGDAESAAHFLRAYAECGYAEESVLSYAEELRSAVRAVQDKPDEETLRCLFGMYGRRSCALHDVAGAALMSICDIGKENAAPEEMLLRLADGISGGSRAAFLALLGLSCFKSSRDKARLARADARLEQIASRLPSADAFETVLSWCLYVRFIAKAVTDKRTHLRETPASLADGLLEGAAPEDVVALVAASWSGDQALQGRYGKSAERVAAFFGTDVSACKDALDADPALKKRVASAFYSASVYTDRAAKGAKGLYDQRPYAAAAGAAAEAVFAQREGNRRAALDDTLVTCALRRQEFDRAAPGAHAEQAQSGAKVRRRKEGSDRFLPTVVGVCAAVVLVLSALLLVLPPAVYPDSFAGAFWENVLSYVREWPVSFFFPAAALILYGVSVSVGLHDSFKRGKDGAAAHASWVDARRAELDRRRFLLFCVKATLFSVLPAIFYDLVWMIVYFIR